VATRMSSISGPSGYTLEPVREAVDFTLYRGRQQGNASSVLAVALAAEQPSPQSLRRLEHEYSLAAELDPAWAATPLALTRQEGRTILLLKDPGGEPLDLVLERRQGQPLDLSRFLRVAIGLTKALGRVHRHGLIHKASSPRMCLSTTPETSGSSASGLPPNCRASVKRLCLFDSHFHSSHGSVGRGGDGPSFPRAEEIARRHWSKVNQKWVDTSHRSSQ
jgi:hypothetical protein